MCCTSVHRQVKRPKICLIYGHTNGGDVEQPVLQRTGLPAPQPLAPLLHRLSTKINRKCHKFQPSFLGATWRELEGWSRTLFAAIVD